jgi:5-methylcytosine-specific restriction endonuclease McrA
MMPLKTKEARKEYNARYWAENKERLREVKKKWDSENGEKRAQYEAKRKAPRASERERLRALALQVAGGECVHCHNKDPRVLHFDHVIPIMGSIRRPSPQAVYRSVIEGSARGLQLLCANCHAIKIHEEGSRKFAHDIHYRAAMRELSLKVYQ